MKMHVIGGIAEITDVSSETFARNREGLEMAECTYEFEKQVTGRLRCCGNVLFIYLPQG